MNNPDDPSRRFEVRATSDSHFSWLRTRFAVERTMMAYQRTAVSLIGFGFAIVQFFQNFHQMPRDGSARFPGRRVVSGAGVDLLRRPGVGLFGPGVPKDDSISVERQLCDCCGHVKGREADTAVCGFSPSHFDWPVRLLCGAAAPRVAPCIAATSQGQRTTIPGEQDLDFCSRTRSDVTGTARERPAGLPLAREAERIDLQHRLHLLLLPVQGIAVPERQAPHVRGHARGLYPPIAGVASRAASHRGLAGRRAHADEARLLRACNRTCREVPSARPDRAAHIPDQRPAARRRLVRVLQAAQFPRRPQRRRPARTARHLPRRPPRPRHIRPRDARPGVPAQARGRLQHPVHGQRGQPAPWPHRLSLLSRRAGREVGAVHPDHRARHRADDQHRQQGLERAGQARSACSTRRPAIS